MRSPATRSPRDAVSTDATIERLAPTAKDMNSKYRNPRGGTGPLRGALLIEKGSDGTRFGQMFHRDDFQWLAKS